MKKIITMLLALYMGCASQSIIDSEKIFSDLKTARKSIARDRKAINDLTARKAGKTGFYYIIGRDGVVVYHPVAVLIGSNFKKYNFLDGVLKSRSGCFQYTFGHIRHLIFFESLNENDILCLAIPREEVPDADKFCKIMIEKSDN